MGYYGVGKGFRVNGVMVGCGLCVHKNEPLNKGICHDCWKALYYGGDAKNIAFQPEPKEYFLRLAAFVREHEKQITGLRVAAEELEIPFRDILHQVAGADIGTLEISMDIK